MKTWKNCEIVELEVSATAFGPLNPDAADSEKYAVKNDAGEITGWETLYGEKTGFGS